GVVLGLRPDGVQQHRLGIVRAHARDLLEGGHLLLRRAGQILLRLVEFALPLEELAVALLEHLGALVELLVALDEPSLLGGQLVPARARLFLSFTAETKLLVLRLEDELLLAGECLRTARPRTRAL